MPDPEWVIAGLIAFGLFKPRLAMHWYYIRKHLFWRRWWWLRRKLGR